MQRKTIGTIRRSTPCVGVCSTTYGDLVCRGCKRFAHEIVEWNGFNSDQQAIVWDRLQELREGAVGQCLRVCDYQALMARAEFGNIPDRNARSPLNLAYEVLRMTQIPVSQLADIGIQASSEASSEATADRWTRDLVREIDQEFYARSLAHYEHNFKIAAQ